MYIKQIIIHGFKSYSKKTTIENVDKRHNVVVGRNGSGKSNFFSAIEFVLSNEYNNLRLEQRKALINQTASVASAFVEIIFDNRDAQLPVDREVVHIRRTISQSKDQYTLDGKAVARKEVVQLLEMGGLSNASPYYIVKQGKINQLATARPFQLLQVLLEVSGIRSYNEQRESSLASMKQTEGDMKIVLESRARHDDEIKILKQELMEFEQYEKFDKKRRVIKFVMLYNEKTEIGNELSSLGQASDKLKSARYQLAKQKVELLQHEDSGRKQLKQLEGMLSSVVEQKSIFSKEHHRYLQIKTNLELKDEDLTKDLASESQRQAHSQMQLDKLNKKIQDQKDKLNELVRQCAELHHQEDNLTSELKHKEQMRGEHLDKQRRGVQFATRVERDRWLKEEIASLKKQIHTNTIYIHEQDKELDQRKKTIVLMEQKMDEYRNTFQKISERMDNYKVQINELKLKRDDLLQHQQNIWEQISRVQQELAKHKEDYRKMEQTLKKQINSQVITGGDSIRKVIDKFRSLGSDKKYVINGYFGQIIDNIECDESIYKAVETTAGLKLFNHVVESNDIAKEIIQVYNQQKLPGTFQFMPLNLLATHKYQYPSEKHAVPLISLLKYEKKHAPAIQMVFGKTILCSDLSLMPESALECGLACVTYEGDQNIQGVLKGGYHAPKPSILKLHRDSREVWKEIIALEEELVGLQSDLDQTVCRVTECERKMSQEEGKLQKFEHVCEMERIKNQSMPESLRQQNAACELLERKIRGCKNEQELMRSRENALIAELDTDLTNKLTEEDQKAIEQLDGEIRQIRLQQQTLFNSALDANKAKHKVENLLNSNLLPKHDELVRSLEESSNREDKANELAACRKRIQSAEEKMNYYLEETLKLEEKYKSFQERKESLQKEQRNLVEKLKKLELEMDSIATDKNEATKQQDLKKRLDECSCKIDNLGALPPIDRMYFAWPQHKLARELENIKKQLKQVSNINPKVQDEYNVKLRMLNDADKHLDELQRVKSSIQTLLNHLEIQREDTVRRTFESVNNNFKQIFQRFVPGGKGHLILNCRNIDRKKNESETIDRYAGIGIEVSFVGGKAKMSEMNQLSGGQKTLVAVALIFAIQQYKPAPFYLFDEIDQALDRRYRESLADQIHEMSSSSQFITTTFRRELLAHADKFYGVRCRDKVSYISQVLKNQAYDFITDVQVHD